MVSGKTWVHWSVALILRFGGGLGYVSFGAVGLARAATCDIHTNVEEVQDLTNRSGMGVGKIAGSGLYLGTPGVVCDTVRSISITFNSSNLEELGAIAGLSAVRCLPLPLNANWYRFWVMFYAGTESCNSTFVQQQANT